MNDVYVLQLGQIFKNTVLTRKSQQQNKIHSSLPFMEIKTLNILKDQKHTHRNIASKVDTVRGRGRKWELKLYEPACSDSNILKISVKTGSKGIYLVLGCLAI